MSHLDPKRPTSRGELRKFGLLVGGAFLVIGAIAFYRRGATTASTVLLGVGAMLAMTGGILPQLLGPIYKGWMRFALLLSKVTTPLFMGIIYFLLLTPIGVAMRLFGRHALGRSDAATRWVSRAPGSRASALERQF